ncbi:MAG: LuxR C-terminal-related transcriptional regulator [Propionibacteriaceae bacterium]|jgi:DNA-binding CsgD family transcriptional regulator|nr:LuxR C-terminal-related transcriptional regulator [Propionibacteriaceae bacterium]
MDILDKLPRYFVAAALSLLVVSYLIRGFLPDWAIWSFVYPVFLVLVVLWGISWYVRAGDHYVRKYLIIIAALIAFWVVIRIAKLMADDPGTIRMLWYLYYVGFTMLPVFLFWISLRIGGLDEKPYHRWLKWTPLVISTVLLALVLTNDWTQLVFRFPNGIELAETDYTRGWPYYVIAARGFYLAVAFMVITVLGNKRVPAKRLIPLEIITVVTVFYGIGYAAVPHLIIFREMTIVYCTLALVFAEICSHLDIITSRHNLVELRRALALEPPPVAPKPELLPNIVNLTAREKELLGLLMAGDSPKQIARKLAISQSTVNFHTTNLYRKVNVSSRHELLAKIIQLRQPGA